MCNIKPGDILEMIKKNKTAANLTGSWQTNFWMRNGSSSGSKKKYFLATNVFLFLVNIRNKKNKKTKIKRNRERQNVENLPRSWGSRKTTLLPGIGRRRGRNIGKPCITYINIYLILKQGSLVLTQNDACKTYTHNYYRADVFCAQWYWFQYHKRG